MKKVIISFVMLVCFVFLVGCSGETAPVFEIDDFELEHETGEYSETYTGKGEVITDADGLYYVYIMSEREGGATEYDSEEIISVFVEDGEGEFGTYDSSYGVKEGDEFVKPDYDFEIIGYEKIIEYDD